MNFVRSNAGLRENCRLGPRESFNQVTTTLEIIIRECSIITSANFGGVGGGGNMDNVGTVDQICCPNLKIPAQHHYMFMICVRYH